MFTQLEKLPIPITIQSWVEFEDYFWNHTESQIAYIKLAGIGCEFGTDETGYFLRKLDGDIQPDVYQEYFGNMNPQEVLVKIKTMFDKTSTLS